MVKTLGKVALTLLVIFLPAVSLAAADLIEIDGYEDTAIETTTIFLDVGASYSFSVEKQPSHGNISNFREPNYLTYTPDPNYHGADSFSVKIHIDYDDPDVPPDDWVGVYNVSIQSVNDYPVAHAVSGSTFKDTPVSVQLSGSDPVERSSLTYAVWTFPEHGVLHDISHGLITEEADETVVYTPEAGFVGTDTFTFVVHDGTDFSYEANATITVTESRDLIVSISGSGSGSVNSIPSAIFCITGSSIGCSAGFTSGSTIKLTQTASATSDFDGWSGACTGTGECQVIMDQTKEVGASFTAKPARVRIDGDTSHRYQIGATLDQISTGGATVRAKADIFQEEVIMASPVAILLKGGFTDLAFSSRTLTSVTVIDGSLKIRKGLLRLERLSVR